ncbi:hypothetical protein [Spirosoma sp. KUDC1026]|uniref:hypothetical protein n=1 Tax=Spirosoma sp. KUDC1026 TaxID=2745947 RepID=UPI00159BA0C9|nr:hypothetical protein [Spirosoma sp. KUDC1026]QKZ12326.1 hypothetical protein HU175_06670 [Spirosoma sp. KUDC1026]
MLPVTDPLFRTRYGQTHYLRLMQQVYIEFGELRTCYTPASLSRLALLVDQLIHRSAEISPNSHCRLLNPPETSGRVFRFSNDELLDLQDLLHGSTALIDLYDFLHSQLITVEG